jgi:hypothetical protein
MDLLSISLSTTGMASVRGNVGLSSGCVELAVAGPLILGVVSGSVPAAGGGQKRGKSMQRVEGGFVTLLAWSTSLILGVGAALVTGAARDSGERMRRETVARREKRILID